MLARSDERYVLAGGIVCVIAGVVVLALGGGIAATIAGAMLLGVAGIAFVSLLFLIIGHSEEDDRTRHPRG
jgi:formate hydrogenlyase subunit 3/multisubunit Na+/H+ antiporter MnhD subunit